MAIETCYMYNNTSLIPDESLAHRLGLIPINVDPRLFKFRGDDAPSDENNIVFSLQVTCKRIPGSSLDAPEEEKYSDSKGNLFCRKLQTHEYTVYSGQLKWLPQGKQKIKV